MRGWLFGRSLSPFKVMIEAVKVFIGEEALPPSQEKRIKFAFFFLCFCGLCGVFGGPPP